MAKTEAGTHTPESLATIAAAIQAIAARLTKTAEAMKEKGVATLAIRNHAGLKTGLSALRSFGMAAEEAFEEWVFDQNLFPAAAETTIEPPPSKPERPERKPKRQAEPKHEPETD